MFMGGENDHDPQEGGAQKPRSKASVLLGQRRYREECPTFFYDCSIYYALGGVKTRQDEGGLTISRNEMWAKFGKPFQVIGMTFRDADTERSFQEDRARRFKQFLQVVLTLRIFIGLGLFAWEMSLYDWDLEDAATAFVSQTDVWGLNVNLLTTSVFAVQLLLQTCCLNFVLRHFTALQIPFSLAHISIVLWAVSTGRTFDAIFCPLTWEDVVAGTYNVTVAQTHVVIQERSLALTWILTVSTDFLIIYRLPFIYNFYGVLIMIGGTVALQNDFTVMFDRQSVCRAPLDDLATVGAILVGEILLSRIFETFLRLDYANAATVFQETKRSDQLLGNVLPAPIIDQLKSANQMRQSVVAHYPLVSVLFADIVSFTTMSARLDAETLVELLNRLFLVMDTLCDNNHLEKIKTIGDCYMCAGGVPIENNHHFVDIALMGLQMVEVLSQGRFKDPVTGEPLRVRVGVHCGPVTAGVIGQTKFLYDLWGDAVNTSSRMESHGQPMRVHCSQDLANLISGRFTLEDRGEMYIKGKGNMRTYFITGHVERKLKWRTID